MLAALVLTSFPLPARAQEQPAAPAAQEEEDLTPREAMRREAARLAQQAGTRVQNFATYSDSHFEEATKSRTVGWIILAAAAVGGALALFFGWTLVKSLLVPFAPVLGLATGVMMAFFIIEALYTGRPIAFRLTVVAVGALVGVAAYLFSALRAKPVAAFLVILSPFLMLSAFFFPLSAALGLVIFCIGFVAGFFAMIELRPLAIIATSVLGACAFFAVWGLLSHLVGEQAVFVRDFFEWLIANPYMLAMGWAVCVIIGCSFQFTTGPRGTLEG
jgi:hypothetical protein